MTDREMLELAAKAAGYTLGQHSQKDWVFTLGGKEWTPLTDDGDAMRLAVKLGLWVMPRLFAKEIAVDFGGDEDCREGFTNDPYAATRRAIVRAAAEIGKEMK